MGPFLRRLQTVVQSQKVNKVMAFSLTDCNNFLWQFIPEAGSKNVLLWSAVFEGGTATAAAWRDDDVLVALRTTNRRDRFDLESQPALVDHSPLVWV